MCFISALIRFDDRCLEALANSRDPQQGSHILFSTAKSWFVLRSGTVTLRDGAVSKRLLLVFMYLKLYFTLQTCGFTLSAHHLFNLHSLWRRESIWVHVYLNVKCKLAPCQGANVPASKILLASSKTRRGQDCSIVRRSEWKQLSLGINPKISRTPGGARASKRGREERGIAREGKISGRLGKSYLGRVFGD